MSCIDDLYQTCAWYRRFLVSQATPFNLPEIEGPQRLKGVACETRRFYKSGTCLVKVVMALCSKRSRNLLKKQDCMVADCDGCCRVVLCEDDVGKLNEDGCYRLEIMMMK